MSTEENIKITDNLANAIVTLLKEKLSDNKRRAYPMPDIYKSLEKEIKETYPETDRYRFQKALSLATKSGQIKGYEIKLGKNGGIGLIDYKKSGVPETVQVTVIQTPKEFSALEFSGRGYRLEFSKDKLEKLLTKVFRVQEDPDGELIFDERRFSTENADIRECLDNFLFHFNESEDVE